MNKITALLIVIAAIVVVGGLTYVFRPEEKVDLSNTQALTPTPTVIDDTKQFPPPTPEQPSIIPINQTVQATLKTTMGDIELELNGTAAPYTVGNFVQLAKKDFYDGTTFHRVIPDFMIQGGDPLSRDPLSRARHGTGGPEYKFRDEINDNKIVRGALAMANAGPNTNGSQFFIVTGEAFPHLDGRHTVFGTVTVGMDIADAISQVEADANDNPIQPITVTDVVIQNDPTEPALKLEDN